MSEKKTVLIIGAGAAGMSFTYSLLHESDEYTPIIIEADCCIGGLARTVRYDNTLADIGPHRFFTNNENVFNFWKNILDLQGTPAKDDILLDREIDFKEGFANPESEDNVFLRRRRFSRIYYGHKFFDYPVKMNLRTILNMGILKTMKCGFSYIKSCFCKRKENNLEDFMINRFGKVLYGMFFEFYTQKVWGRHPKNISKEWGEQRIKGLSLLKALLKKVIGKKEVSLTEEYFYPKYGAGQMWDVMADYVRSKGGEIILNSKVKNIYIQNNKVVSINVENLGEIKVDYVVSSMPIRELIEGINNAPENIREIAAGLPYRDYQLISFNVNNFNLRNNTDWRTIGDICPDSWIYVQDREVKVGRIYIPKNFSPYMQEDINETLVCMEYFCDKGDELWNMSDDEIYEFASSELVKINAIKTKESILKSYRFKAEQAYPAYFDTYKDFKQIQDYIDSVENLYCIGRNGQHKYNNMDHSTLSGIVGANAVLGKVSKSVLWEVNTEQSYQEVK